MIINQILAITWFVICCFWAYKIVRYLPTILDLVPESDRFEWGIIATVFLVLDLIGIAASVLLLFGATWARWLIGLVAFCTALGSSCNFDKPRPYGVSGTIMFIVSVISVVILIGRAANIFHF